MYSLCVESESPIPLGHSQAVVVRRRPPWSEWCSSAFTSADGLRVPPTVGDVVLKPQRQQMAVGESGPPFTLVIQLSYGSGSGSGHVLLAAAAAAAAAASCCLQSEPYCHTAALLRCGSARAGWWAVGPCSPRDINSPAQRRWRRPTTAVIYYENWAPSQILPP